MGNDFHQLIILRTRLKIVILFMSNIVCLFKGGCWVSIIATAILGTRDNQSKCDTVTKIM
jgi:hypothetical protein